MPDQIDLDLNLDCNLLRQQSLNYFKKTLGERVDTIPRKASFMFGYFYALNTAFFLMNEALEEFYDQEIHKTEEGDHILNELVDADVNRVTVPLAIAAWLTTDNWRAHEYYPEAPEDLSYGLVTDYPIPILRLANQFLNPTSSYSFEIDKEFMQLCKDSAVERVKESFPKLSQDQLDKIIPSYIALGENHT